MDTHRDQELRRQIEGYAGVAEWGAWGVAAGLVMEVGLAYWLGENRPWTERWLPVVADVLVALGVIVEIQFGRKATNAREEERMDAKQRLAAANQLAKEATLQAARARERAAKIERTTAWRRVSPQLRGKLLTAVGDAASSLVIKIEHQTGDPEAHCFANDIGKALADAGVRNISLGPNEYPHHSYYGLLIAHAMALDISLIEGAFRDCGVAIDRRQKDLAQPTLVINGLSPNLYVFVGMKPWPSSLKEAYDAGEG
jgi:hypothetical protein